MFNKEKMSLWTRARLCWTVLAKGEFDPEDYKSRHAQKQWDICEQRRRDMEASIRPSADCPESEWF